MSQKKIDEIIKNEKSGKVGQLGSVINWLIPKKSLARGFHLLKKEDAEHLIKLIEFNYDIKSLLLHEFLRIESYITTRFEMLIKNETLESIEKVFFPTNDHYKKFIEFFQKKFSTKSEKMTIIEMFDEITFGSKVSIIDLFDADILLKHFTTKDSVSKREFIKTLHLAVEIRNKVAHQSFIVYKGFIESIIIVPLKKDNISRVDYYYSRIDLINSFYGTVGFRTRVRRLCKKYETFLDLKHVC